MSIQNHFKSIYQSSILDILPPRKESFCLIEKDADSRFVGHGKFFFQTDIGKQLVPNEITNEILIILVEDFLWLMVIERRIVLTKL